MSLGSVLKNRRKELGLTLAQVAGEAGISVTYLSDIEHDRRRPGSQRNNGTLCRLAKALSVLRCISCQQPWQGWPTVCPDCRDEGAQAVLEAEGAEQCRSCGMFYDGGMRCTYCGDPDPTGTGDDGVYWDDGRTFLPDDEPETALRAKETP